MAPEPTPTEVNLRNLYIKGPSLLNVSDVADFRAEPLPGGVAARYFWGLSGGGDVAIAPLDPGGMERLIKVTGVKTGYLTLSVAALDAEGNKVAYGSRTIYIQ